MESSPWQIFAPPIPADVVLAIMRRVESRFGRRCHFWPAMRDLQRTREDGWTNAGGIGVSDTGLAFPIWWNRERRRDWLWEFMRMPRGGVRSRRFVPPRD